MWSLFLWEAGLLGNGFPSWGLGTRGYPRQFAYVEKVLEPFRIKFGEEASEGVVGWDTVGQGLERNLYLHFKT